jgi:Leucine-rich repeat (LRR) protein
MAVIYNKVLSIIITKHPKDEDPTDRRTRILDCARILSKGRGLADTNNINRTAQWKAVNWLTEGAGRNIDIPDPCVWGSSLGSLYALIVTRESLGVPDESWHRTKPLASFDQVCHWKRITCDLDQEAVKRLILSQAGLNGTIPIEIAGLEQLATLEMENNNVMGTIPSELGEMTNLESLFLQETFLTGKIPNSLGRLSALKELLLDKTRLTGSMPLEVCQLRNVALYSLHADCRGGGDFGSPALECEHPHCCTSCS